MNLVFFSHSAVVAALLFSSLSSQATAQNSNQFTKSSSGLTLSIMKTDAIQNNITLHFNVTNDTNTRAYVRDARVEDSQQGFLGSGPQLNYPSVTGIEICTSVNVCINPDSAGNLNNFSYIEPHDSLAMSFTYKASTPVRDTDTISFSVAIVARFAKNDPAEAAAAKAVRFNFPYTPLNRN